MKHGEGVLQITVGNMSYEKGNEEYKGSWVEDKMEGYGTYRYTSGAKYTGEWKANKHHGKGNLDSQNIPKIIPLNKLRGGEEGDSIKIKTHKSTK